MTTGINSMLGRWMGGVAAPASDGETGASAAAVWGYVLSNGLTAEQTLVSLLQLAKDLHRIHGLESGSPMTVTQTSRSVAGIVQSIAESAGSVIVTRTG